MNWSEVDCVEVDLIDLYLFQHLDHDLSSAVTQLSIYLSFHNSKP